MSAIVRTGMKVLEAQTGKVVKAVSGKQICGVFEKRLPVSRNVAIQELGITESARSPERILENIERAIGDVDSEAFEFVKKLQQAGMDDHYVLGATLEGKTHIDLSKFDAEAFRELYNVSQSYPYSNCGEFIKFYGKVIGPHGEFSAKDLEEITTAFSKYTKIREKWTAFNFRKYKDFKSVEELSLPEKHDFLTKLVSNYYNETVAKDIPILPKTKADYQKMIEQLLDETSLKVKPLGQAEQKSFISVLEDLPKTNGEISETQIQEILRAFPKIKTPEGKLSQSSIQLLNKIMKDGRFADLPKEDKLILQLAALFKDSSSIQGIQNIEQSAFNAFYLAEKLNLPHESKLKLYALVKNQNIMQDALKGDVSVAGLINTGCELRHNGNLQMFEILSDAQITGENIGSPNALNKIKNTIRENVAEVRRRMINIPQSDVPKASQFVVNGDSVQSVTKDGVTNIVVYLDRKTPIKYIDKDGVEKILDPADVHNFYHATNNMEGVTLASRPNSKYAFSTSYAAPTQNSHHMFSTEGTILKMNGSDIFYTRTMRDGDGTGFGKEILPTSFLLRHIDENFGKLIGVFEKHGCKSLETLRKTNPQAAEELHQAIVRATPQYQYGETMGVFPEPVGVFFQGPYKGYMPMYAAIQKHKMSRVDKVKSMLYKLVGKKYEESYKFKDVPLDTRQYAQKNDFAVFHLGN